MPTFFTETEQAILKSVYKLRISWIAKINLRKNNKARGIAIPDFKTAVQSRNNPEEYSTHIKADRHIDEANRIESQENTHIYVAN